jgi:hypothetical protein
MRFIKNWPNTFDPRGVYPVELRYLLAYTGLVVGGLGLLLGLVFIPLFIIRLILLALGVL